MLCCCSVTKLCLTPCDPMDCSTPGFLVLHHLPELAHTHVHWISDAIQPSHPLSPPPPALNLSQHQGLFQWVGSSHQVAKVSELQLQHQSFQWIIRVDFHQDWLVWSSFCPRDSQESSPPPQFQSINSVDYAVSSVFLSILITDLYLSLALFYTWKGYRRSTIFIHSTNISLPRICQLLF